MEEEENYGIENGEEYVYQDVIEGEEQIEGDDLNQQYQEDDLQMQYADQQELNQYVQEEENNVQDYSKKVITTTTKTYQTYEQNNQVEVAEEQHEEFQEQEQQNEDLGDNLDEPAPEEDDLIQNQKIINTVTSSKVQQPQKQFPKNNNQITTKTTTYKYEFNKNKNQNPVVEVQNENYDDNLNQQEQEIVDGGENLLDPNQVEKVQNQVITNENKTNPPVGKKVIKKVIPGKIMEETNNYRLYVSGIGYVDEYGNPIKTKSTTRYQSEIQQQVPIVKSQLNKNQVQNQPTQINNNQQKVIQNIPEPQIKQTNEVLIEDVQKVPMTTDVNKNQFECVPNQNTNVYRQRTKSSEPIVYFRNLGIHSKTNEYGKRQFYRVIEATPVEYNNFYPQQNQITQETVLRAQPVQTVIQQVPVVCPKHSVIRTTQNVCSHNICPVHDLGGEEYEVVEEIQEVPVMHQYQHTCQHQCPVHSGNVVRSRQQQILRSRGRTPVTENYSRVRNVNQVSYHEKRQPQYLDNYKFKEIRGTSGAKKK